MQLSNEQLFEFIIQGNEDLKPILWERIKKLVYMYGSQFYRKNKRLCISRGIEETDIKQAAYIAYCSTFDTYTTDKQYTYETALKYALQNELRREIGSNNDVLNREAESIDAVIGDGEGYTMAEVIPDTTAAAAFETVEDRAELDSINATLRHAVNELPTAEKNVVTAYYFKRHSFKSIAECMEISGERVRQIHTKALRHLRNPKIIRRLQDDLGYNSYSVYYNPHVDRIAVERAFISEQIKRRDVCIETLQNVRKDG